jgi:hypothetical protein
MKKFSLVLAIAALALPQAGHAGWWKTYGGENEEAGFCVQVTSDNNYIISGDSSGDVWLLKVDTLGTVIWSQTYEGTSGRWVEETSDGGFIVSGSSNLIKTDSQGDSVWAKDCSFYSLCVQQTLDGGYILIGSPAATPLVLLKTDSDGNILWTKEYEISGHNFNLGFFVKETSDGGFIITGETGISNEEYQAVALWLLRTNSDGDTLWTKTYGGENNGDLRIGLCVKEIDSGGYIVTGSKSESGIWLLRTDENGDTLWTKTYGGGMGNHILQTHDRGYMITGGTESGILFSSLIPQLSDLWMLKVDSLGDTLWTREYGGIDGDVGRCIQQTPDSGYIVVGETWSFGGGMSDIYLLRTDSLGLLGIDEDPLSEYPRNWHITSSIGSQVVLKYSDIPGGFRVQVFDALGRKVEKLYSGSSTGTLTWGSNQPSGVYFIKIQGNKNKIYTERIVIIR